MTRRERLERAIDRAIALLDTLDGDPDAEPSLGKPEDQARCVGNTLDLEYSAVWGPT